MKVREFTFNGIFSKIRNYSAQNEEALFLNNLFKNQWFSASFKHGHKSDNFYSKVENPSCQLIELWKSIQ